MNNMRYGEKSMTTLDYRTDNLRWGLSDIEYGSYGNSLILLLAI